MLLLKLAIISQIICNFKKIKIGNEINIATSKSVIIKDLIDKIALKMNYELIIEVDEIRLRPLSSEVDKLLGDNKKLLNILGNFNFTSLDEDLDITIDYLKIAEAGINHNGRF